MKMEIFSFLPLLILSSFSTLDCAKVVCYFNSLASYRPGISQYTIDDIPFKDCTHIIYAFIGVDNVTWTTRVLDPEIDINQNGFKNFTGYRETYPDVKFMIALGSWTEEDKKYSTLVSTPKKRTTFINSMTKFIKKYSFDGLDLDWTYSKATNLDSAFIDRINFYYFVRELRAQFQNQNTSWQLTMTVPLAKVRLMEGFYVPELCRLTDAIHITADKCRGKRTGIADVHMPLIRRPTEQSDYENQNVADEMQLWMELGCPPNKLVMGVPFYGRLYTSNASNNSYNTGTYVNKKIDDGKSKYYTRTTGCLPYYEICDYIQDEDNGWAQKKDSAGLSPYIYKGTEWISYDDEKSLSLKMNHIKKKGYGGAMTSAVDMDDFRGICGPKNPLIRVLSDAMKMYIPRVLVVELSTNTMNDRFIPSRITQDARMTFTEITPSIEMYPPEINLMVTYHKKNYTTTQMPTTTTAATITTEVSIEAITDTIDTIATEEFVVTPVSEATTTVIDGDVGGQLVNSNDVIIEQTFNGGPQKFKCRPGTYLPSTYCNKFLICNHGKFVNLTCSPGTVWNQKKTICDWPSHTAHSNCI